MLYVTNKSTNNNASRKPHKKNKTKEQNKQGKEALKKKMISKKNNWRTLSKFARNLLCLFRVTCFSKH